MKKVKKAQKGKTVDFNTTGNWADNYSLDTTGYSKKGTNYFPYKRSVGTKGVFTKGETKEILDKVKKGKYKKSDWTFKSGGKVTKAKAGKQMLKRADGSYSQRGLWDNIRANKGSGKKPTAAMLKQERKIKAKTKK